MENEHIHSKWPTTWDSDNTWVATMVENPMSHLRVCHGHSYIFLMNIFLPRVENSAWVAVYSSRSITGKMACYQMVVWGCTGGHVWGTMPICTWVWVNTEATPGT